MKATEITSQFVKNARASLGVSQYELATMLGPGVTRDMIAAYEYQRARAPGHIVLKLQALLSLNPLKPGKARTDVDGQSVQP